MPEFSQTGSLRSDDSLPSSESLMASHTRADKDMISEMTSALAPKGIRIKYGQIGVDHIPGKLEYSTSPKL